MRDEFYDEYVIIRSYLVASSVLTRSLSWKRRMIGIVACSYVTKRFRKLSSLSSVLNELGVQRSHNSIQSPDNQQAARVNNPTDSRLTD